MKVGHKLFALTVTLTLLTSLAIPCLAAPQGITSLLATAHGKGTLKVGQEVFNIAAVVVKLQEDGTGEITLITDLQLFVTCTWSATDDLSKGVDLKVTGGTNAGGAEGTGKLFLRSDGKTIDRLLIDASSNTRKRKIEVNFFAD